MGVSEVLLCKYRHLEDIMVNWIGLHRPRQG